MPSGGARPGTGGKRTGAGRKPAGQSPTKRVQKTTELAEKQAGEGILPLAVLLWAMRHYHAQGDYEKAADIAAKAAPYHHRKKPTELEHSGKVGLDLEILESIRVAADSPADQETVH